MVILNKLVVVESQTFLRAKRPQRRRERRNGRFRRPAVGRLPHAKMLLVSESFFLCWVDYALEGSTFSLSRLFHTERSWHTYRFTLVFVSGQQDLPSEAGAFSLTSFEA